MVIPTQVELNLSSYDQDLSFGTGNTFRQHFMYLINNFTFIQTLGKKLPVFTILAGAFGQISDVKIKFVSYASLVSYKFHTFRIHKIIENQEIMFIIVLRKRLT